MAQDRFMIKNLLGLDENDNCPPFNPPVQPVHLPAHPAHQRLPFQPRNIPVPAQFNFGYLHALPPTTPLHVALGVFRNRPIPVRHNPMAPRRPGLAAQIPRNRPVRPNPMPPRRPGLDSYVPTPPHDKEMDFDYFIEKCTYICMTDSLVRGLASKFDVYANRVTTIAGEYRKEHEIKVCSMRKAEKLELRNLLLEQPMMSVQRIAEKCNKTEEVVIAFWVTEWFLEGDH